MLSTHPISSYSTSSKINHRIIVSIKVFRASQTEVGCKSMTCQCNQSVVSAVWEEIQSQN